MNIYYDKDIDYAEIFLRKQRTTAKMLPTESLHLKAKTMISLLAMHLKVPQRQFLILKDLPTRAKVAFLLKATREMEGFTQEQVIKRLAGTSGTTVSTG